MNIEKEQNNNTLLIRIEGRLDTNSAPDLEEVLLASIEGVEELIFDVTELDYISSAGLRVLLSAQKTMNKQGSMKVTGVSDTIMEIFEVTGFTDILTIEQAD